MNACYGNLKGKSRKELERLAVGEGTDDECTVVGAQLMLAELERAEYRERQEWLEARGQVRLCD